MNPTIDTRSKELASAVKSAILHEIESNPQVGWVRADALTDSRVVAKLKREVEELPKPSNSKRFAGDDDFLEIPVYLKYSGGVLEHIYRTTWNNIFLLIGHHLIKKTTRSGVKRALHIRLNKELLSDVEKLIGKSVKGLSSTVDSNVFDKVLDTFVANGLLRRVAPPRGVISEIFYWQTSPRGMRKLAELRAVKPSRDSQLATLHGQDQFDDLETSERELLTRFGLAPAVHRPNTWEWVVRFVHLPEFDAKHFLHSLEKKGYLRSIRHRSGESSYDFAPRGIEFFRSLQISPLSLPEFFRKYDGPGEFGA